MIFAKKGCYQHHFTKYITVISLLKRCCGMNLDFISKIKTISKYYITIVIALLFLLKQRLKIHSSL